MTPVAGFDRGRAVAPMSPDPPHRGAVPATEPDAGEPPAEAGSARSRKRPRLVPPAGDAPAVRPTRSHESAAHVLAAELHDGLSQQLFAAELDVHELRCTPGLAPEVRQVLDRLALRLETGSRDLRSALFRMLETEREQEELTPLPGRVRDAVAEYRASGHAATLRVHGAGPDPSPAAARLLLRTVREGLANVVKHASASEVLVVLRCGGAGGRSRCTTTARATRRSCGTPRLRPRPSGCSVSSATRRASAVDSRSPRRPRWVASG